MCMKLYLLPVLANALPTWAIVLIIVGSVVVVLNVISAIAAHMYRNKKAKQIDDSEWFDALGGKENVKSAMAIGSRLNLVLNDYEAINREALGKLGVVSTFTMSNKIIMVLQTKAEYAANVINEGLKSQEQSD